MKHIIFPLFFLALFACGCGDPANEVIVPDMTPEQLQQSVEAEKQRIDELAKGAP